MRCDVCTAADQNLAGSGTWASISSDSCTEVTGLACLRAGQGARLIIQDVLAQLAHVAQQHLAVHAACAHQDDMRHVLGHKLQHAAQVCPLQSRNKCSQEMSELGQGQVAHGCGAGLYSAAATQPLQGSPLQWCSGRVQALTTRSCHTKPAGACCRQPGLMRAAQIRPFVQCKHELRTGSASVLHFCIPN